VLEEDYAQRKVAQGLGARSIDNEISQIARAVATFNAWKGTNVSFSSTHFATDYLRSDSERLIVTKHDLSKDKNLEAKEKKRVIMDRIVNEVLIPMFRLIGERR
jgi:hypothetical protein